MFAEESAERPTGGGRGNGDGLAQAIIDGLTSLSSKNTRSATSELFQPRRMAYVFQPHSEDASDEPTTLLRSKHDCPPSEPRIMPSADASLAQTLASSLSLLYGRSARSVRKQKKKEMREKKQREAERAEMQRRAREESNPTSELSFRSHPVDEDIFADVGTDFAPPSDTKKSSLAEGLQQSESKDAAAEIANASAAQPKYSSSYFGEAERVEVAQPAQGFKTRLRRTGVHGGGQNAVSTETAQDACATTQQHSAGDGGNEYEAMPPPSTLPSRGPESSSNVEEASTDRKPNLPDNIFTRGADEPWKRRSGKKPTERLRVRLVLLIDTTPASLTDVKLPESLILRFILFGFVHMLQEGLSLDDDSTGYFEMDDAVQAMNDSDEPMSRSERSMEKEKKKGEADPERKVRSQLMQIQNKFEKEHGGKHAEAFKKEPKSNKRRRHRNTTASEGDSEDAPLSRGPSSTPKYEPGATPSRKRTKLSM